MKSKNIPPIIKFSRFRTTYLALLIGIVIGLSGCTRAAIQTQSTTSSVTMESRTASLVPTISPTNTRLSPTETKPSVNTPSPVIESLEPTETSVELSSIQPQNVQSISEVFSMSEKDVQRFDWIPNQYSVLFYYPDEIAFFDQETKQSIGKIAVPGVTTSATSPSGKQLAILPGGSEILVYQIPEGENIFSLKGHTGAVSGLNYSPDGKNLASSADDNSIRIWDTTAGELLQTWSLDYWPETIVYSPDGKQLAAIDNQNFTIHILSTNDGAETGTLTWTEHASPVLYEAIFSPDWSSVAWIARGTVQLMDVDTGDLGATLSHEDFVSSAAWTPDGELIVTAAAATVNGDFKPVANFWDPQSGRQINQLIFDNPILSLSFTTDGHLIGILDSSSYWSAWGINP